MFASPTITWRRRYFWASACGSSRVLTIGRLRVVSRPISSSKKSARWLSWYGDVVVRPSRQFAADLAGTGEHLAGDEVRGDLAGEAAERQLAGEQVVLVTAVAVALAVGVVLVDDDLGAVGQDRLRRASSSARTISSAARSQTTASIAVVTSGVEISGWAWST